MVRVFLQHLRYQTGALPLHKKVFSHCGQWTRRLVNLYVSSSGPTIAILKLSFQLSCRLSQLMFLKKSHRILDLFNCSISTHSRWKTFWSFLSKMKAEVLEHLAVLNAVVACCSLDVLLTFSCVKWVYFEWNCTKIVRIPDVRPLDKGLREVFSRISLYGRHSYSVGRLELRGMD